jgi:hypothetical protein
MNFSRYFLFVRQRPDRAIIKEEWILRTINNPLKTEVQTDGRIRKWSYIEEMSKYLRVILLEDGETVHNAFLIEALRREKNENSVFSRYRYGAN